MQAEDKERREILKHRVITMLDRKEMEFLDRLGKDALFSTGHKLSYSEILEGLIDVAMEIGLSGENIDSLNTLKDKMLARMQESLTKAKKDK